MMANPMHLVRDAVHVVMAGLLRISVSWPMYMNTSRFKLTETMNTMASSSRDISLHAVVSSGLPQDTNSNPGGGIVSVTT